MLTLSYAFLAVKRRARRNILTLLAVIIGTSSLVALIAVTESSAHHTALRLTQYEAGSMQARLQPYAWAWEEEDLLTASSQIPDVLAAGTLTISDSPQANLSTIYGGTSTQAHLALASPQGLAAREASIVEGRYPVGQQVLLGRMLARQLGVSSQVGRNQIKVEGSQLTVSGILVDGPQNSALSTALLLPPDSSLYPDMFEGQRSLYLKIKPGSSDIIEEQLPAVLDPGQPGNVSLASAPSPRQLKEKLGADSRLLVQVVLVVMVVATSFGIILTMQMSVWERRREIGISRALGLTGTQVLAGFLAEATFLGLLGSVLGFFLGLLIAGAVSILQGWLLILPSYILFFPLLGAGVGALGGTLPAVLASRVQPLELLN